ncbi:hypothetical protein QBC39DRAFT_378378 [Podospora conica]|nr:hypothetical protein QBC39DRAFT_378378 [Schizothecium conicum]
MANSASPDWQFSDLRHKTEDQTEICVKLRNAAIGPAGQQGLLSGLAASIVALRWLLSHLMTPDTRYWDHVEREDDDDAARELRAQAAALDGKNPLLQYVWREFPTPQGTREEKMVAEEQERLLEALGRLGLASMSFADVMENPLMEETFWAREPLVLAWCERVDGEGHAQILQLPGYTSLVPWGGDALLGDQVASFGSIPLAGSSYLELHPNDPFVIRVMFTPSEGSAAGFDQLNVISVPVYDSEPRVFALVAVVRLRADASEEDMIRVYHAVALDKTVCLPA